MKYFYIKLRKLTTSLLIASFGFLIFSDCARNPVTGKKELSLWSTDKEIKMGKSYDPQVVAQYGLYEDAEMQADKSRGGASDDDDDSDDDDNLGDIPDTLLPPD